MTPGAQQHKYIVRYMIYGSEVASLVLNLFTLVLVFITYCVVRISYEISRLFRKILWYFPNRICRSPVFVIYYNRMLVFLDEWRQRATTPVAKDGNKSIGNFLDETVLLEEDSSQGRESNDSSTSTIVPFTETPRFVIAEVHTHNTPESDKESPQSVRFRDPAPNDSSDSPATRKSLVHELEESKIDDDGSDASRKNR